MMQRATCIKCNVIKNWPDDFAKRYDKSKSPVRKTCKACWNAANRRRNEIKPRRKWNKESNKRSRDKYCDTVYPYLVEYKRAHPCVDCGENDPLVLDFDHIDPTEKSVSISTAIARYYKLDAIKQEIEKCEIRCANCHRRKTAHQLNLKITKYL